MQKKLLSALLVLVMMLSLTTPVFAVTDVDHPAFNRDALREVVAGQTASVAVLIANALPADTIKALARGAISGMLDTADLGNLTSSALSGLLEKAVGDALGIALPDSVNLAGIIRDVLNNDVIHTVLTSDFIGKVIDRTVDNLIDAIAIEDIVGALSETVVDRLTDEIWNNANPSSGTFLGVQTGHWNTTGGWNRTNIGITNATRLGRSGVTGGIYDYVDPSKIDFASILGADTILRALRNAVTDTAAEYYTVYKPVLIARVQEKVKARVEELREKAKADLVDALNAIFQLKLSARDDLKDLEAKLIASVNEYKGYIAANPDKILKELNDLRKAVNVLDRYACLDLAKVNALLDKLIQCMEGKKPPVTDPVPSKAIPSAVVEKLNGNKNNLTITVTETWSNGTTKQVVKTFSIDNNAADTYTVGAYKVYVDTKGNVQIRACYLVD